VRAIKLEQETKMKKLILSLGMVIGAVSPAAENWINASNGQTGSRPVYVGREGNADVYVCRAGGIPGKLVKRDGKCYIGYYGKEYAYNNYQVLQDTYGRFRFFYTSSLSDNYLVAGGSENGTPLHICRVRTSGGFIGGKMVGGVNGGICYYGYYGKEYSATVFEALTDA
jgi:hypothetical protein